MDCKLTTWFYSHWELLAHVLAKVLQNYLNDELTNKMASSNTVLTAACTSCYLLMTTVSEDTLALATERENDLVKRDTPAAKSSVAL